MQRFLVARNQVPMVFAETRPLAKAWTFRYLGAAAAEAADARAQPVPTGQSSSEVLRGLRER
jgi:hypothetical protein